MEAPGETVGFFLYLSSRFIWILIPGTILFHTLSIRHCSWYETDQYVRVSCSKGLHTVKKLDMNLENGMIVGLPHHGRAHTY